MSEETDVKTARADRLPPSPSHAPLNESVPDRYQRIAKEIRELADLDPLDQRFLFELFTEQNNAITWGTDCLSCSRTLDGAYEETVKREEAEAMVFAMERTIAALRAELDAMRVPLPLYGTNMAVRHAHTDRLTAYTYSKDHPALGDTVIAFDLSSHKGVISRVKDIRKMPNSPLTDNDPEQYALDLDWLPEHW